MSVATDNLHELLVGRWLREGHADHPAVLDEGGVWSFAQLDAAAARAAGTLSSAGVRNGDRVAIVLPDSRVWAAAFLGATRLGAVAVALNPDGPVDDPIEDAEPTALVASPG